MAKSLLQAYALFFFGGFIGLHHIYLNRDVQSILWSCSCGGFFFGMIYDFFRMPAYIRYANCKPNNMISLKSNDPKDEPRPPIKIISIIGQILFAHLFSIVFYYIIPPVRDLEN